MEDGECVGVMAMNMEDGTLHRFRAHKTVLATGGYGRAYFSCTSAHTCSGDGNGMVVRAGLPLQDLEFVQFHPTALYLGPGARGQQPLVSEALRGEGAVLRDGAGERFMLGVHPLAELAPRDVVAKAITRVQLRDGVDHVWLDARAVPDLTARFPTIVASCRAAGIDPAGELVPVTPAAHYASAGYCTPDSTLAWDCANCGANPSFKPIASGGDGATVQYCECPLACSGFLWENGGR